mmetsp:Transcript_10552/g.48509  ORF Transcript_10552/g.48509 Transcript_10552/m.48509 type:complete len:244 (-) Transcript_10552:1006-1737(-)
MHPSPCSTRIRSHSLTGVSGVTALRSFMYPLTGLSSWPLIVATSTSVTDTTPMRTPLSVEMTGHARCPERSRNSPTSAIVISGRADMTFSDRRITSLALRSGGTCSAHTRRTSSSRIPSTSPSTRHRSSSSEDAIGWSMRNAADAALGCPPPLRDSFNNAPRSTVFTGLARPMTLTWRYGFFFPCTYETAMKSASESVRSKTSLAHVAIPGEYSSHSTCTLLTVIPWLTTLTTSVIPRAMTSR